MQSSIGLAVLAAALGGLIGGVLQSLYFWNRNEPIKPLSRAVIVLLGVTETVFYFKFGPKSYGLTVPLQYAVFATLVTETVWEKIRDSGGRGTPVHAVDSAPHQTADRASTAGGIVLPVSGQLLLNGWIQVLLVGCFGALLAELDRIRPSRRRRVRFAGLDYFWSAVVILTSGVLSALHGVNHVNALTVAQLGATGPQRWLGPFGQISGRDKWAALLS